MDAKTIGNIIMGTMAVLGALGTGALVLPVDPSIATPIVKWAGVIVCVYTIINPFLPADVFGPLKPSVTQTKDKTS